MRCLRNDLQILMASFNPFERSCYVHTSTVLAKFAHDTVSPAPNPPKKTF